MNSQMYFMYMLKTMVVAGIFLVYYYAVLRNKRFHQYNRFYLLISLVLSLAIPLLHFTPIRIDAPAIMVNNRAAEYFIRKGLATAASGWPWQNIALALAAMVTAVLLSAMIINITKIYRLKGKSVVSRMGDVNLILTEDENAPFSFLNNLFWKETIPLKGEAGSRMLKHELTHIVQKHSLDRIFTRILCAVCWLNPFYWLIQKELAVIHEFIADETAIGDASADSLARMLLQAHYGNHFLPQTQSFFYSSIKRRLFMLSTKKNIRYSYARRVVALPLFILAAAVCSFEVHARNEKKAAGELTIPIVHQNASAAANIETASTGPATQATFTQTVNSVSIKQPAYEAVFTLAQAEPKFPGGSQGWQQFLSKTCNLDMVVSKGGAPGKYSVQLSFLIDKDGDVRDVKALNDPGYGSKEDAMRVLLSSPRWAPAMQNGRPVVYRHKIAITYQVSED